MASVSPIQYRRLVRPVVATITDQSARLTELCVMAEIQKESEMTGRFKALALATASLWAVGTCPANAVSDLTGTDVTITGVFPDSSTFYGAQTFTVGPGAELTCPGGGAGGGVCSGFLVSSEFDIGANTLTLDVTGGTSNWTTHPFNGYEFSGLSAGGPWTGYTLSTTFGGLDSSRITFTPDAVWVNMSGIAAAEGNGFTVTLTTSVPEVSTWAMMLLGGLGLASFRRSKRVLAIA
jgi:hypothetical protein